MSLFYRFLADLELEVTHFCGIVPNFSLKPGKMEVNTGSKGRQAVIC